MGKSACTCCCFPRPSPDEQKVKKARLWSLRAHSSNLPKSSFRNSLARLPWTNYLASLCFSFLICKVGTLTLCITDAQHLQTLAFINILRIMAKSPHRSSPPPPLPCQGLTVSLSEVALCVRLTPSKATVEALASWTQGVCAWPTICPWIAVPSTVPNTSTVIPEQEKASPFEGLHGLWAPREEGRMDISPALATGDSSSSR